MDVQFVPRIISHHLAVRDNTIGMGVESSNGFWSFLGYNVSAFKDDIKHNVPAVKYVYGPHTDGCYYIDRGLFHKNIFIRYRFGSKLWEWKNAKSVWEVIPTNPGVDGAATAALIYLRDQAPFPSLQRHIKEIRTLGSGFFGTVYRVKFGLIMGHDRFLPADTYLALKTIQISNDGPVEHHRVEASTRALENEMKNLRRLSHPTIIKFYQCIDYNGNASMVTEYCAGGTLNDIIKRAKGHVPEDIVTRACAHMLQALSYLHANHILHRDIKPDNIFVFSRAGENPIYKLGDFGICKELSNTHGLASPMGFRQFLAPEFYLTKTTSIKSDIWAFGLTLYAMCVEYGVGMDNWRHFPFETVSDVLQKNPQPIPNIAGSGTYCDALLRLITMCLTKSAAARPSTHELLNDTATAALIAPFLIPSSDATNFNSAADTQTNIIGYANVTEV
jgi:serine/threonine protein kinase